jgi:raffinose/stachyose/melibiose transport system permease protein
MKKTIGFKITGQVVCIIFGLLALYPLILMVKRSFDNGGFNNYRKVLNAVNPLRNYFNSIIAVGATLVIVAVVVSMAAFAFSKLKFRGSNVLFFILLTGMMIPTAAMIFSAFSNNKKAGND